ncbi:hypothetical protein F6S2_00177 [Mycoplasma anatis]|uniref:beta-N-acetylglucosaminidase domain-containing protein n=2 Tax=Mycoplasmopsis anatis TaxID=171279 RepID=UPI001C4DF9F0|nr:beta-N-acetylglucosaminidase domain-containing protein [Mycoplasmopsis anatis]MBW0594540.1 hypothetical protein [Mycoplasmopsis anatis]MBW0595164.1 hypothetical protein [Mycoplasmopsis anatis]MBW0597811.1 hypothetical protein [Mycoplasmopsis anatis]MBW0598121.1 hypothetical protein [Mycoplasmopsis anatis]MBW0598931.1 hypothetical protein [Mycoplasmopsis anatis]
MKKQNKKKNLTILALSSSIGAMTLGITGANVENNSIKNTYEIYPNPHKISYDGKQSLISKEVNIVIEDDVDQATIERFKEALALKGINNINFTRRIVDDKTNFIFGIKGNRDTFVDDYIVSNNIEFDNELMNKIDAYVLSIKDNVIAIYGNEVDSTFYGTTTLWHILNQIEGLEIENIKIEDYADVKTRGAIEGYYGNPWTVEDRINYMNWGGYYKLNAYFYAPKDDPKHNRNWAELYTDEEINNLIKPIAEAGNKSKVRFIYALHPFMHNRLDNGNVEDKKAKLKAKFLQVIEAGVRQISILADDAAKPNETFQINLLREMVDWLKELKETRYPDLKTTLPYVVQEYMGWGETYFKQFPPEVQIVMTGGTVWGQVTKNFTDSFTNKINEGPMLWINWPCTDNSKEHLIMGGYKEFLQPNVNPKNVEGIILNPMQQSEPSKIALFGNAVYSWNLWKSADEADKAWNDSFKHVDNKSTVETPVSKAFRELSKHMINQKMDSRVVKLEESLELKPLLYDLINKLSSKIYTTEQLNKLKDEFNKLNESAKIFLENGNDRNLVEQMRPFLESWIDLTDSGLIYLDILAQILNNNITSVNNLYQQAKNKLYLARNNHKFRYLSEMKNAEVGPQHIQPFLDELDSFASRYLKENLDNNFISMTWISNVFTTPSSGNKDQVFNVNTPKSIQFRNPVYIMKDDYIGVEFNKEIELNNISISMGGGKNHFYKSKLQYKSTDGEWTDLNSNIYERPNGSILPIEEVDLKISNVKAIRLISLQNDVDDKWLTINSFIVNKPLVKEKTSSNNKLTIKKITFDNLEIAGYNLQNLTDGSENTEVHLRSNEKPKYDGIRVNQAIVFHFDENTEITKFTFVQGTSNSGDVLNSGIIEYFDPTDSVWKQFGSGNLNNQRKQTILGYAITNKIRIRNLSDKQVWWRVAEAIAYGFDDKLDINYAVDTENIIIGRNPAINDGARNNKYDYLFDNNPNTIAWMGNSNNGNIQNNSKLIINFDKTMIIDEILIRQGNGDNLKQILVEGYNNGQWVELNRNNNAPKEYKIDTKDKNEHFSKLRISSLVNTNIWWKLADVQIVERKRALDEFVIVGSVNSVLSLKNQNKFTLLNKNNNPLALSKDSYIGLDLKSLQKIESVSKNIFDINNAQIQISLNGIAWENINLLEEIKDKTLRYIRILNNNSESDININFDQFTLICAQTNEFGQLVKTTLGEGISGWGDSRYNKAAFDGKMNTQTKFGVSPKLGQEIIYDLGKEIDIYKLRIYAPDSTSDFPRSIDVMYSNKIDYGYTKLFSIADVENRDIKLIDVPDDYSFVDSKYPNVRFFGNIEILETPVKARYIKLLITKNYPNRALIISEIQINDGEYISLDNDPRFVGELETEKNTVANKMIDGDFLTYYEPKNSNSSIVFYNDDPQPNKFIKFITSGDNSDAIVEIKTADSNENINNLTLGKLSLNNIAFRVPKDQSILELKVSWSDIKPKINEVIFYNLNEHDPLNKEELTKLLNSNPEDFELWIEKDKNEYKNSIEVAKKVIDFEHITQNTLNELVQNLKSIANLRNLKGDFTKINIELENEITNFDDYLSSTVSSYKLAVQKAKTLVQNPNATQKEIDYLVTQINNAKSLLRFSPLNKDSLQVKINEFNKLDPSRFSVETYNLLKDKVLQAKQLISDDNQADVSNKIHPSVFKNTIDEYESLYKDLIDSEKGIRYKEYLKIRDLAYKFIDENGSNWQILSKKLNTKVNENNLKVNNENSTVEIIDNSITELEHLIAESQRIKALKIADIQNYSKNIIMDNSLYTEESYNNYKKYATKISELALNPNKIFEEELDEILSSYKRTKEELQFKDDVDINQIKQIALDLASKLISEQEKYSSNINEATEILVVKNLINEINEKLEKEHKKKLDIKCNEVIELINQLSKENNDLANSYKFELNNSTTLENIQRLYSKVEDSINLIKSNLVAILNNELTDLENVVLKEKILNGISKLDLVLIDHIREFINQVIAEKENELITKISKLKAENNNLISQLETDKDLYLSRLQQATDINKLIELNNELKPIIQSLIDRNKQIALEKLVELKNKENYEQLIKSSSNINELKSIINEIKEKISKEKNAKKVLEITEKIKQLEDDILISELINELNGINDFALYDTFEKKVEQKIVQITNNLKLKAKEIFEKLENKENLTIEEIEQIKTIKELNKLISELENKLEEQNNSQNEQLINKKNNLLNKISKYNELNSYIQNINNAKILDELNIIEQQIDLKISIIEQNLITHNAAWAKATITLLNRDLRLINSQKIHNDLINTLNQKITQLKQLELLNISEENKNEINNEVSQLLTKTNSLLKSNLVSLPLLEIPTNKDIIKNNLNIILNLLDQKNNYPILLELVELDLLRLKISEFDYSLDLDELIDKHNEIVNKYDDLWINSKIFELTAQSRELISKKEEIYKFISKNSLTDNKEIVELLSRIDFNNSELSILEYTTKNNEQKDLINQLQELSERVNNEVNNSSDTTKKHNKLAIALTIGSILTGMLIGIGTFIYIKFKKLNKK